MAKKYLHFDYENKKKLITLEVSIQYSYSSPLNPAISSGIQSNLLKTKKLIDMKRYLDLLSLISNFSLARPWNVDIMPGDTSFSDITPHFSLYVSKHVKNKDRYFITGHKLLTLLAQD